MNIWEYNFQYNAQAVLFNLFLLIVAIYKYRGAYFGKIAKKESYWGVFLLLVLFSTFAYAEADFYHYQWHYDMMKHYNVPSISEPIYFWLAQNLPDSFFVWRFSIWGSAATLMILTLRRVRANAICAGLLLPIYFWHQFSITRGGLGFAIIVFSLVLLFDGSKKEKIIALIAIFLSTSFHHSISAFLVLLPLVIIMPFNSKMIKAYMVAFPILYSLIMVATTYLLNLDFLVADTEQLAESYMEKSKADINYLGVFFNILHFSGQLLILYLATTFILKNKKFVNKSIFFLLKYGFVLVYISFLFYGQGTSSFISSRFLHASTFPLVVVYSYYLSNHNVKKSDCVAMLLLGGYTAYELLYAMYKWW